LVDFQRAPNSQGFDGLDKVLPAECNHISVFFVIERFGNPTPVVVVGGDQSGLFELRIVGFPFFQSGKFEIVLDALAVEFGELIVEFGLAQQFLEGEVGIGLDLVGQHEAGFLDALDAQFVIKGGAHVQIVGFIIEGVFIFGSANRIQLITPPAH
jgi:hypothetical protein